MTDDEKLLHASLALLDLLRSELRRVTQERDRLRDEIEKLTSTVSVAEAMEQV